MSLKEFKTLYKKTSMGAIQFWHISVHLNANRKSATIITNYGQNETVSPQITEDVISEGKNLGKTNQTDAVQQAILETEAKWEKQKKKGYVESMEEAEKGNIDTTVIEGGILPMLAHKFSEQGHKITYPAFIQPKLDGIRCIAIVKDGKCTLWTRSRKRITSMPHIVDALESIGEDRVYDGELFNMEYKHNFEHIVSLVRQEKPAYNCTDIQYHIYDLLNDQPMLERLETLSEIYSDMETDRYIKIVDTYKAFDEGAVAGRTDFFIAQGYEGGMVRQMDSLYENKRSYGLQKVKKFDDAEFEIVGIEEGRGKLAGHVGSFICKTESGKEFQAKLSGSLERLQYYFENPEAWKNKKLTIKYQGITTKEKVPRFPVGIEVRDYE